MKQVGFRARLFLFLIGFALIPTIVLSAAWELTVVRLLPILGTIPAMEQIAASGTKALTAARRAPLNANQRRSLDEHQTTLEDGLLHARQMEFLMTRKVPVVAAGVAIIASLLFALVASRVADHLSRNLSRPLDELVGWTDTIGRGEPVPDVPPRKGAPEFVVLRNRMREMSAELRRGRVRALEAERATALRESARQVAHELKNPLTPIRFAIARLRREAPSSLAETIEVLEVESRRLEVMARSFAQFGRLPDGPRAPVDLAEMVRVVARSAVPEGRPVSIDVTPDVPMVPGHVEALSRALTNVLLNAVDASAADSAIELRIVRVQREGRSMVELSVRDFGSGIPASRLDSIWEPYVTHKPGGTGLGLAIVRQTLLAHEGEVEAVSVAGKGTTMRLFLPADTPTANGARHV